MIGLDTNVLVRYLTWDDPPQARQAADLVQGAASRGTSLFVSDVVMCELVWVLEGAYGLAKDEVALALDALLRTAQLDFADRDVLLGALSDYRTGPGDFADHVVGRDGSAHGCRATATFDRALARSPHFEVLS